MPVSCEEIPELSHYENLKIGSSNLLNHVELTNYGLCVKSGPLPVLYSFQAKSDLYIFRCFKLLKNNNFATCNNIRNSHFSVL